MRSEPPPVRIRITIGPPSPARGEGKNGISVPEADGRTRTAIVLAIYLALLLAPE